MEHRVGPEECEPLRRGRLEFRPTAPFLALVEAGRGREFSPKNSWLVADAVFEDLEVAESPARLDLRFLGGCRTVPARLDGCGRGGVPLVRRAAGGYGLDLERKPYVVAFESRAPAGLRIAPAPARLGRWRISIRPAHDLDDPAMQLADIPRMHQVPRFPLVYPAFSRADFARTVAAGPAGTASGGKPPATEAPRGP
jgi:hypothetical protein